jgi:hypothetical protein
MITVAARPSRSHRRAHRTSSQFGPRLLRNFRRTRATRSCSDFIATSSTACSCSDRWTRRDGMSCPLYLRVVRGDSRTGKRRGAHLFIITYDLDPRDRVIEAVYNDLLEQIRELFPESTGTAGVESRPGTRTVVRSIPSRPPGRLLRHRSRRPAGDCRGKGHLISVPHRPGEYIVAGGTLVEFTETGGPTKALRNGSPITDHGPAAHPGAGRRVCDPPACGSRRARPLPRINDPFTAISCVDRLGSALCYLTGRAFPSPCLLDGGGALRVIVKPATFSARERRVRPDSTARPVERRV